MLLQCRPKEKMQWFRVSMTKGVRGRYLYVRIARAVSFTSGVETPRPEIVWIVHRTQVELERGWVFLAVW